MLSPEEKQIVDAFVKQRAAERCQAGKPLFVDLLVADVNIECPNFHRESFATFQDVKDSFTRLGLKESPKHDLSARRSDYRTTKPAKPIPRIKKKRQPKKREPVRLWPDKASKERGVRDLAVRLKLLRETAGLSRRDVAGRMVDFRKKCPSVKHKSVPHINSCICFVGLIELGRTAPGVDLIRFFSELFNVSFDSLMKVSLRARGDA